MVYTNNKESLNELILQGALFLNTNHSSSIRVSLFEQLVKRSLYNLQSTNLNKIDLAAITGEVSRLINPSISYNFEQNIPRDYVIEALGECKINEEVVQEGDYYLLSEECFNKLKASINKVIRQKEILLNFFISRISEIILIESEEAMAFLKDEVMKFLFEVIDVQCVFVAQALEANTDLSKILSTTMSHEKTVDIQTELQNTLMNYFENENLKVAIILDTIIKSFYEIPQECLDFINTAFNTLLNNKILRIDPKLKSFQDDLLKERIIYLDDNVVLSAMLTKHPYHTIVREVLSDCRKLGMKLRITPEIVEEINAIFKFSRNMKENKDCPISDKLRNGVVKEYFTFKLQDWDGFQQYFLPLDTRFCIDFGVEISSELYDKEECLQHQDYNKIFNIFKDSKDFKRFANDMNEAGENTINHDVVTFITMQKLLTIYPPDVLGQKVLFVSLDTCLRQNQFKLKNDYPKLYSKHILEFIRFLLPYKVNMLNDMSHQDYIKYLINNDLGNLDSNEENDILSLIKNNNIELNKLVAMEPTVVREIITALSLKNDYNEINTYLYKIREIKEIGENPIMLKLLTEIERKNEIQNLELYKKNEAIKMLSKDNEVLGQSLNEINKNLNDKLLDLKKENLKQRTYMYGGMAFIFTVIIILQIIAIVKK